MYAYSYYNICAICQVTRRCCSDQIIVYNTSCYNQCHCYVRSVIRPSLNSHSNWSDVSICDIEPAGIHYFTVLLSM